MFDVPNWPSIIDEHNKTMDALLRAPVPSALSYSDTQFEILMKHIKQFESGLSDSEEVGLLLTNFGQSLTMHVTEIGYEESVLMIFRGYINGNFATLIQHVSQLNFLLMAVPVEPERPKRPIGFSSPQADKE